MNSIMVSRLLEVPSGAYCCEFLSRGEREEEACKQLDPTGFLPECLVGFKPKWTRAGVEKDPECAKLKEVA